MVVLFQSRPAERRISDLYHAPNWRFCRLKKQPPPPWAIGHEKPSSPLDTDTYSHLPTLAHACPFVADRISQPAFTSLGGLQETATSRRRFRQHQLSIRTSGIKAAGQGYGSRNPESPEQRSLRDSRGGRNPGLLAHRPLRRLSQVWEEGASSR